MCTNVFIELFRLQSSSRSKTVAATLLIAADACREIGPEHVWSK